MSTTFLRGLALLEILDRARAPIGVSELARRLDTDKGAISRMVTACEADGWVARVDGGVAIGPRAALLGHASPTTDLVRRAEPIAQTVAGITGLLVQVVSLVGSNVIVIAAANGNGAAASPTGLGFQFPLWASAGGKLIAAQLAQQRLDALLPASPYPDPWTAMGAHSDRDLVNSLPATASSTAAVTPTATRTRDDLDRQLTRIRADGSFEEHGEVAAEISCIGTPWPQTSLPTALVCVGTHAAVADRREYLLRIVRAAVTPGATRDDIVTDAALALASR